MAESNESALGTKIEVTEKMIKAGAFVLSGFETETGRSEEYWAKLVYVAMREVELEKN